MYCKSKNVVKSCTSLLYSIIMSFAIAFSSADNISALSSTKFCWRASRFFI